MAPTYSPNDDTYETLAELVRPYALSRIQLTEAVGIATKPTVNSWVKQCCPNLPQGTPVPLAPFLTPKSGPAATPTTSTSSKTSPRACSPAS